MSIIVPEKGSRPVVRLSRTITSINDTTIFLITWYASIETVQTAFVQQIKTDGPKSLKSSIYTMIGITMLNRCKWSKKTVDSSAAVIHCLNESSEYSFISPGRIVSDIPMGRHLAGPEVRGPVKIIAGPPPFYMHASNSDGPKHD